MNQSEMKQQSTTHYWGYRELSQDELCAVAGGYDGSCGPGCGDAGVGSGDAGGSCTPSDPAGLGIASVTGISVGSGTGQFSGAEGMSAPDPIGNNLAGAIIGIAVGVIGPVPAGIASIGAAIIADNPSTNPIGMISDFGAP